MQSKLIKHIKIEEIIILSRTLWRTLGDWAHGPRDHMGTSLVPPKATQPWAHRPFGPTHPSRPVFGTFLCPVMGCIFQSFIVSGLLKQLGYTFGLVYKNEAKLHSL